MTREYFARGEKVAVVFKDIVRGILVETLHAVSVVASARSRVVLANGSEFYVKANTSEWRGYGKTSARYTIRHPTAEDIEAHGKLEAEKRRRRELVESFRQVRWAEMVLEGGKS